MDNDGFKDLVRGKMEGKTSKEIAREAVEDEFRRKNRKRGGPKGGNDDYSSSDDDDNDNRKKKSKHGSNDYDDLSTIKRKEDDEIAEKNKELAAKYRDRAKERREGMEKIAGKTGGGGEKRGLDMELVRRQRREILQQQGRSLGESHKGDDDEEAGEFESIISSKTIEEAMDSLSRLVQSRVSENGDNDTTSLLAKRVGSEMLDYIEQVLQHHAATTSKSSRGALASKSKLRTRGGDNKPASIGASTFLAFALDGHPSDKVRSWESPRVFTTHDGRRGKNFDGENGSDSRQRAMATPVDSSMIRTIELVLSRSHDDEEGSKADNINGDASSVSKKATPKPKTGFSAPAAKSNNHADLDSADDDDDIFGGAGDYVPPTAKAVPLTSMNEVGLEPGNATVSKDGATKKGSIFSGLVASGQNENDANKNDGPDDVDNFVTNLYSRLQKRGANSKPEQSDAYGDEMDVDFDGRLADAEEEEEEDGGGDDTDAGKKKRKKKKQNDGTTVAAKEYGSGRGQKLRESD